MKRINLNKIVNTRKLVHRIFIMLWVVLAFCLAFKFLFNWWFPIVVNNQAFISLFNLVDDNKWLYHLITLTSFLITDSFWLLIAIKRKKYPNWWMFVLNLLGLGFCYLIKCFQITIGNIIELIYLIGVPIFINIKNKRFKKLILDIIYPAIVYGIINLWQLNILLIRDVQTTLSNAPTLIGATMQIDYYIFIIIFYGEVNLMGLWGGWFFGKSETELLALKEEELKKEKPDEEKIKQIDARLEELKKEEK